MFQSHIKLHRSYWNIHLAELISFHTFVQELDFHGQKENKSGSWTTHWFLWSMGQSNWDSFLFNLFSRSGILLFGWLLGVSGIDIHNVVETCSVLENGPSLESVPMSNLIIFQCFCAHSKNVCGSNFAHKHKLLLDINYRQLPGW